ncbi:MAG TPA: pyridoxamine 5'-phosphate oxidase family protein [Acidimicrobiales bacterium]|nr:pyridoxamine 5'-phosphate oxidase family protein [Acidimicrobiales bacterium]
MSVPVDLDDLAARLAEHRFAYLVTVGDDRRAHVVAATPVLEGGHLVIGGLGRHSTANAAANAGVTLVWPPVTDGGYSLIVDGTAAVTGEATVAVVPAKAILHRPAPGPEGSRCGSDCLPIGDPPAG